MAKLGLHNNLLQENYYLKQLNSIAERETDPFLFSDKFESSLKNFIVLLSL